MPFHMMNSQCEIEVQVSKLMSFQIMNFLWFSGAACCSFTFGSCVIILKYIYIYIKDIFWINDEFKM
jgi:hypothetical protein